jgi:hypothetical protein
MLRKGSGISDEIITARGYRTVTRADDLRELGFSLRQAAHVPGLLLPVCPPDGSNGLCAYRPNNPRIVQPKRGSQDDPKILKYELPKGAHVRLDCPPVCRPLIGDPNMTLWITEGQKKADALASQGLCAIALLGVWNFKGKNDDGGVTLLADWDCIALKGRVVRIVFDSDVMQKSAVRAALERLMEHLRRRGASIQPVYLPSENGKKVGVDDYLLRHSIADLEALAEQPRPQPRPAAAQVELLLEAPNRIARPLTLIDGEAYAAVWHG